ncbi:MAG: transglutaminase-like domain-containing protein [Candidatus Bathyarchaeota archaeon]|nr:transglutaminase-like domain-containing protein [Candidatus Bathyarchaeota archaeon]
MFSEIDNYRSGLFFILFLLFSLVQVLDNHNIAQSLATSKNIEFFKKLFGKNYNYTELIQWEHANIKWNSSSSMQVYTDPIKIYEYGQARCGGYAILYVALCLSQGYEARMVVNIFGDHAWAEIKLNDTWTRVDPSPTGAQISNNVRYPWVYEERWGTPPILALAFDGSSIIDVTSNYRSDRWSLLSWETVIFGFISGWFAICIIIIWKFLFRPLRDSFM